MILHLPPSSHFPSYAQLLTQVDNSTLNLSQKRHGIWLHRQVVLILARLEDLETQYQWHPQHHACIVVYQAHRAQCQQRFPTLDALLQQLEHVVQSGFAVHRALQRQYVHKADLHAYDFLDEAFYGQHLNDLHHELQGHEPWQTRYTYIQKMPLNPEFNAPPTSFGFRAQHLLAFKLMWRLAPSLYALPTNHHSLTL